MELTGWMGLALGVIMVSTAKVGTPPVILDIGPVVATPAPTPKSAERKRLITTITVQNSPEGESVISFEATDFADEGQGKLRTIASKTYSFAEEKPELRELSEQIIGQLRHLERDLLEFAERAGPPKERAPVGPGGGAAGGSRPYR
jgi:hypothetical protein